MGDGNRQVFMMMRYPVSMGALGEDELDHVFQVIRKDAVMADKDCTLGASVTSWSNPSSGNSSPRAFAAPSTHVSKIVSKFERISSDGAVADVQTSVSSCQRFSAGSSPRSSLSGNSASSTAEVTKGFYCKSAPAYTATVSDKLNPAIVVELFTNWTLDDDDNAFVDSACFCIRSAIQDHILTKRSLSLSIHFLISTPVTVNTYQPQILRNNS